MLIMYDIIGVIMSLVLMKLVRANIKKTTTTAMLSRVMDIMLATCFLIGSSFLRRGVKVEAVGVYGRRVKVVMGGNFPLTLRSVLFPVTGSVIRTDIGAVKASDVTT